MTNHTLTFGQFLEEFRRDYGGWSENTWQGNSGLLKRAYSPLSVRLWREIEEHRNHSH